MVVLILNIPLTWMNNICKHVALEALWAPRATQGARAVQADTTYHRTGRAPGENRQTRPPFTDYIGRGVVTKQQQHPGRAGSGGREVCVRERRTRRNINPE